MVVLLFFFFYIPGGRLSETIPADRASGDFELSATTPSWLLDRFTVSVLFSDEISDIDANFC